MERTSAAQWAKRVENWKDSGLTAKEFAATTGIKASSLTYWKWKLGTGAPSTPPSAVGESEVRARVGRPRAVRTVDTAAMPLVEVPIESVSATSRRESLMLELVLDGTVTVRVPRDFDEATLKRLVRALS